MNPTPDLTDRLNRYLVMAVAADELVGRVADIERWLETHETQALPWGLAPLLNELMADSRQVAGRLSDCEDTKPAAGGDVAEPSLETLLRAVGFTLSVDEEYGTALALATQRTQGMRVIVRLPAGVKGWVLEDDGGSYVECQPERPSIANVLAMCRAVGLLPAEGGAA